MPKQEVILRVPSICDTDELEYLGIKRGDKMISFMFAKVEPLPKCYTKKCKKHA